MKYSKINLLLGPPGSGKTYAGEEYARQSGAALVFYQCHAWTSADELFVGVDVRAAVAGEAENVRQPGVLAIAAEKSLQGPVVLLIDELDKAPDSAEALLLDFLQSGRVPVKPGEHLQANLDNLTTFITSNQERNHSGALMRRCKRFFFRQFTPEKISTILGAKGHSHQLAFSLAKLAGWAAREEGNDEGVSLQEIDRLIEELHPAMSWAEFKEAFAGWCLRNAETVEEIMNRPHIKSARGNVKVLL